MLWQSHQFHFQFTGRVLKSLQQQMALKMGRRATHVQDTPGGHCEREHLLPSLPSLSAPTCITMVSLLIQETRSGAQYRYWFLFSLQSL